MLFMKKLAVILICFMPLLSWAQLYSCRGRISNGYDFWLYLPDDYSNADSTAKPVIMFLHGRSLSGNDLSMVRHYGCIDALEKGCDIDAIVVAPQTSNGWNPQKVMDVYGWVKQHYIVDTNRLYVVGMSMGGYGVLDFVATYPEQVAAAMALCGGATVKDLCGLNEVPLWIIHGTADSAVPASCSTKVVESMRACGPSPLLLFDLLPKVNHTRLARIFYLDQTYDWLFAHTLDNRVLNTDYTIDNEAMRNAYKDNGRRHKLKVMNWKK